MYYYEREDSKERTWTRPFDYISQAEDFEEKFDEGRQDVLLGQETYFLDKTTGEITWKKPDCLAQSPVPPSPLSGGLDLPPSAPPQAGGRPGPGTELTSMTEPGESTQVTASQESSRRDRYLRSILATFKHRAKASATAEVENTPADFPAGTAEVLTIITDHFQKLSLLLPVSISWPMAPLFSEFSLTWREFSKHLSSIMGLDMSALVTPPLVDRESALILSLLLPVVLICTLWAVQHIHGRDSGHDIYNVRVLSAREYADPAAWRWNHLRWMWLVAMLCVGVPLAIGCVWTWLAAWLVFHSWLALIVLWGRSNALSFLRMAPALGAEPHVMLHSFHRMWVEKLSSLIGFLIVATYLTPIRRCALIAADDGPQSLRNMLVGIVAALLLSCGGVCVQLLFRRSCIAALCGALTITAGATLVAVLLSVSQTSAVGSRTLSTIAGILFGLYAVLPQFLVVWSVRRLLAGRYDAEERKVMQALTGVWPVRSTWLFCGWLQPYYRCYTMSQRAAFLLVTTLVPEAAAAITSLLVLFTCAIAFMRPYASASRNILDILHHLLLTLTALLPQCVEDGIGLAWALAACTLSFCVAASHVLRPLSQVRALWSMRMRALLQAQASTHTKDWIKRQNPAAWVEFDFRTVSFWAEKSTATMLGLFPDVVRGRWVTFAPVIGALSSLNVYSWKRGDLTSDDWSFIGQAVRSMADLQRVTGENATALGDIGSIAIARAVKESNLPLRDVRLRNCGMGPAGVAAWAAVLEHGVPIQTLDLAQNAIGADGAAAIAHALVVAHSLKVVNLTGCGLTEPDLASLRRPNIELIADVEEYSASCTPRVRAYPLPATPSSAGRE
ncbi:hypothetical protein TrST_g10344 [Triparma strigata]|uniref:Uncharacterized protein n=2 Tax=Triparma strigata TaxID=1606541 RepID=A0A9W7AX23_9STRA|nr:hypothetical protein TrST_g10344 [Triparma strigata]